MNPHLTPVFQDILPSLDQAGVSYWVYGGIAVAGIKGEFIRSNNDVDLFVLEQNYQAAIHVIDPLSKELGWTVKDTNFNNRPKREFFGQGNHQDLLSIMPVFQKEQNIVVVFQTSRKSFPAKTLYREQRSIGSYRFTTPSIAIMKELFLHNLDYLIRSKKFRDRKELRDKYEADAKVILSEEERNAFWSEGRN